MEKTLRRSSAKTPRSKKTVPEISSAETAHLEQISRRYAEAEKAWLRMTSSPDVDDPWTKIEEHLLTGSADDRDRRWKFFSK